MTDARLKAKQLAAEKYPPPSDRYTPHSTHEEREAFIDGYLTARIVTAEELEAAAEAAYEHERTESDYRWPSWSDFLESEERESMRSLIRVTLAAAGFTVEGEE